MPLYRGSRRLLLRGGVVVAAASNLITLDGSVANTGSGTTSTPSLTTTKTNDYIVLCIQVNGSGVSTITDTAGLTWTQVSLVSSGGNSYVYRAFSSGILTSNVITITFTGSSAFFSTVTFALNGTLGASALDVNGTLPGTTTTSTPLTLTTSNANDLLFASYALNTGTGTADTGNGWTLVPGSGGNFMAVEYKLVTATQSAFSAGLATGTIKNGIGHAVRSA